MAEKQTTDDLAALAAAAQGSASNTRVQPSENRVRAAKVAELRAKYQAGELLVDENALASRMVDALLDDRSDKDTNNAS